MTIAMVVRNAIYTALHALAYRDGETASSRCVDHQRRFIQSIPVRRKPEMSLLFIQANS